MEEIFENVCQECSKVFETKDVNEEICQECWAKSVLADLANEGE